MSRALPVLIAGAAAVVGLLVASTEDPLIVLPPIFALALFLFAALSPVEKSLHVVIGSLAVGCLGRVPLGEVGFKAIALRGEEAAVLGLMMSAGWRLLRAPKDVSAKRLRNAWLAFTAMAAVSLVASARIWTVSEIKPGALYFVRWLGFGAVVLAAAMVAHNRGSRNGIVSALVTTAVALSVLGFIQLGIWPNMENIEAFFPIVRTMLTDPHQGRLVSTMLDPNLLGSILAAASALLMARLLTGPREQRAGAALQLAIILVAIFLTVSRGSLLSSAFGMGVVVALAAPRVLPFVGVGMVGALALAPRLFSRFQEAIWAPDGIPLRILGLELRPEPSAYARWKSWAYAADVVEAHPILGIGYNNYGLAQKALGDASAALFGTDSSVLLILATCGPIGVILYLRLLWRVLADARRAQVRGETPEARANGLGVIGAFASLLLAAIFTNALIYPPVMIVLWTLAGVAAGEADALPAAVKKPAPVPSPERAPLSTSSSEPRTAQLSPVMTGEPVHG